MGVDTLKVLWTVHLLFSNLCFDLYFYMTKSCMFVQINRSVTIAERVIGKSIFSGVHLLSYERAETGGRRSTQPCAALQTLCYSTNMIFHAHLDVLIKVYA